MSSLITMVPIPLRGRLRLLLWALAALSALALLTLLSVAIQANPNPSQDRTVLDWVAGWDLPGLSASFSTVSFLTDNWPAMALGIAGVAFLWLLGMTREAVGFALVGGIIGIAASMGDFLLGAIVDRSKPLAEASGYSFPSGHVFGSTVFFGFWAFLAVHYRLKKRLLVPLLGLLVAFVLSVGAARMYAQAHWPSDVAAGYLLGILWLLALIPFFLWFQRVTRSPSTKLGEDLAALSCESCRVARSIASVVLLDPQHGTATKVYQPPPLVRLLYWLSFQARFPYESNIVALWAAGYRREIASFLTRHRFGKDLVAHATAVTCMHGKCSFVTEFVPGDQAQNDGPARRFLTEVSQTFAEAGLSTWQVSPRNPHAHTNLIRTPDGDFKIIDLESAVVTLVPAPGQWRSSLRSGSVPIFDDIDFPRLRHYVAANSIALEASLGPEGLVRLRDVADRCEQAVRSWKETEPRIWGQVARKVYGFLDWKGALQHLVHALDGAERAGEVFLSRGIARWEAEGWLTPAEAQALRTRGASSEVRDAVRHLGAHLVMSVAIVLPIPGIRSAARFGWTLTFWARGQAARLRPGRVPPAQLTSPNIHTPLVMLLSLIPALGGMAYLASPPLRHKQLVRLLVDEAAHKLPFRLYRRLHLSHWLAPSKRHAILPPVAEVSTQNLPLPWRPSRPEVAAFLFVAGFLSLLTYFGVTTDRQPWDLPITRAIQRLDLDRFGPFSKAIFWMGLRGFDGALLVVLGAALWLKGRRTEAIFMGSIGFFDLINIPLRDLIGRPRPTPDLVGVIIGYGGVQGDSFPSGHSLHTMLFYGYLLYLSRKLMRPGFLRTGLWTLIGAYIPIAGLWLLYDGRHWASDVLGGYVYGTFYLMLVIAGYRGYLAWQRRYIAHGAAPGPTTPLGKLLWLFVRNVACGTEERIGAIAGVASYGSGTLREVSAARPLGTTARLVTSYQESEEESAQEVATQNIARPVGAQVHPGYADEHNEEG